MDVCIITKNKPKNHSCEYFCIYRVRAKNEKKSFNATDEPVGCVS